MCKMNTINFPLLKLNQEFTQFAEFNKKFQELKNIYNLDYKHRSTKYCTTDRRLKNKTFSPDIIFSEYHVQCKGKGINPVTGEVEECPSQIKLTPRDNFTILKMTAYDMEHNHDIQQIATNEERYERYKIIEAITSKLATILLEAEDDDFTRKLELLSSVIQNDMATSTEASPLVHVETTFTDNTSLPMKKVEEQLSGKSEILTKDINEDPVNKNIASTNKDQNSEERSLQVETCQTEETVITSMKSCETKVDNVNTEIDKSVSMDDLAFSSSDSEFEKPKSLPLKSNALPQKNLTKSSKEPSTIKANLKCKRVIKVKKMYSPTVEKVKPKKIEKAKKVVSKPEVQKKKIKTKVSNEDCDTIINKYRNKLLDPTSDESHNLNSKIEISSLNLKEQFTKNEITLQATAKTAFSDLNRYNKKKKMMEWLKISTIAIENSLKQEYLIQTSDLNDPTESFTMISKNDLALLKNHFSNEAYKHLNKSIKTKCDLQWICSKCNKGEEKDSSVLCEACLKWYHYECVGIDTEPKEDWFCTEQDCNFFSNVQ